MAHSNKLACGLASAYHRLVDRMAPSHWPREARRPGWRGDEYRTLSTKSLETMANHVDAMRRYRNAIADLL
jgi:hypothetical protein